MVFLTRWFSAFLQAVLCTASICCAGPAFRFMAAVPEGPVLGVNLCMSDPDTCLLSDDSGFVIIAFPVPDGALYTISAAGYRDTLVTCGADEDTVTIAMRPFEVNDRSLEIVVVASPTGRSEDAYRQSAVVFTPGDITTRAGAVQDIGRYIGTLPSAVSSLSKDFDNTFFVRGGRPSENIFLVDGIEFENVDHFSRINGSGGPLGFINAGNVRTIQFNAGNMSVHHPSRMSSVVDIAMKNGSANNAERAVGFGLAAAGIQGTAAAEGPLAKGKSSYAFSARYLDFEPLFDRFKKQFYDAGVFGPPKLWDFFGKVYLLADDNLDVSATGVLSYNKYLYPVLQDVWDHNEKILQGGTGLSAHYSTGAFSQELKASFSFRKGVEADSLLSLFDTNQYAANPIKTDNDFRKRYVVSARSSLSFFGRDTLSAGVRASTNDYQFSRSDESQYQNLKCYICDVYGNRDSIYASKTAVADKVGFDNEEYGISVDYKNEWGMLRSVFGFRGEYFRLLNKFAPSPRISFSLRPPGAGVFSASAGLYRQFPAELPFQVFDFLYWWHYGDMVRISDDSLGRAGKELLQQAQPSRCWQTSIGYDKFLWGAVETRLEAYFKWYDREYHYIAPSYQQLFTFSSEGRLVLKEQDGKRRAYGIEWWIGNPDDKSFFYSLGASLFNVKNLYNDGKWFDDWTAVRYTYSVSLGACLFSSHTLSFSAQGSGGRPYCPQTIVYDCWDRPCPVYKTDASYYSGRLEKIILTNMRYSFARKIRRFRVELFAEILNLINYRPTLEYQFNSIGFTEVKPFGRIPVLGCVVHW